GGGDYLKIDGNLIPLTTTWTAFRSQTSGGSIIKTVNENYTVTQSDDIICVNGNFTITLPSATGCSGKIFTIENVGTASVSIQTNGVQTIDDDASMTLDEKYAQVTLVSNGSGWYRLGAAGGVSLTDNNIMTGTLTVDNNEVSSSTTTGALVVSGGAGVSGKLYVGDNISTTGDVSGAAATFSGDLDAANLSTSGTVTASGGTFSGNLSAEDTTVNGELSVYDDESGDTVTIRSSGTGIEVDNAFDIENGTTKTGIAIGAGAYANSITSSTTTNPKIAIGYNALNDLGGNTALIRGTLYLDGAGTDPIYYRNSFGTGNWTALEVGGGEIAANSVGYTELAAGSVRTTELADDAVTITKIAGENANGKVITTDGSGNTSWDYVKNAIQEFTVKSGETITAGDIVTYVNGTVIKGVGGQTTDFSVSDPYTMTEDSSSLVCSAKLNDSKFAVTYVDSSYFKVIIGTLSGTSLSWGNEYSYTEQINQYAVMDKLSSSKLVIAFKKNSSSGVYNNGIMAIIADINGTEVTFGTATEMNDSDNIVSYLSMAALSSTKFAILYRDDNHASDLSNVVIGDVSGSTITHGNQFNDFETNKIWYSDIESLSESKIVLVYAIFVAPNKSYCQIGEVTGTNISWGNQYTYTTPAYGSDNAVARLNDNKFVLVFKDRDSDNASAIIGEVNGTVIQFGEQNDYTTDGMDNISVSIFDETRFVVAGRSSLLGKAIVGDVSDKTITWGPLTEFYTETFPSYVACEVMNNSQFVIPFKKGNDNGLAVVGSLTTLTPTGIAVNAGTSGNDIKVAFSGLVDGLSGLSANTQYYADDNGNLTTAATQRFIGTALSTTSLLIQSSLPGAQAIEDGSIVASKLSGSGGSGLDNGTSGQVLQSNGDSTFQWTNINGSPFTESQASNLVFDYTIKNGFNFPMGIEIDNNGKIYVADTDNNQVQVFSSSGAFEYSIGSSFNTPMDIAINSSGKIYVVDKENDCIKVFSSSGVYESTFGGLGSTVGKFIDPTAIAIDINDKIYVTDIFLNCVQVFTSSHAYDYSFGSSGSGTGQFNAPYGIDVDNDGKIYVADSHNNRVQVFSSSGSFEYTVSSQFSDPTDVSIDTDGNIYVSESNNRVQVFSDASTFAYSFDGTTGEERFSFPSGVDVWNGKIYVVEMTKNRVQIFNAPVNAGYIIENGNIGL
ncbi:MAG: hypothetical protein HQK75_20745, partial [Candidatus Magnetomorum sp.]|nr:hypothetical protein [Candidatus Magnetomorum sp.]